MCIWALFEFMQEGSSLQLLVFLLFFSSIVLIKQGVGCAFGVSVITSFEFIHSTVLARHALTLALSNSAVAFFFFSRCCMAVFSPGVCMS